MNPLDNVERRDSDPHAHARLVSPDHDTQELYERHLNAVCNDIRSTPDVLVDRKFVVQVLVTLACSAEAYRMDIAAALDAMADKIDEL